MKHLCARAGSCAVSGIGSLLVGPAGPASTGRSTAARFFAASIVLIAALLPPGCATSGTADPARSAVIYINQTAIGTTPGTITVHRRVGEDTVTLRSGDEVVRQFFIHRMETPRPPGLEYQLFDATVRDSPNLLVSDLPRERGGTYVVPYTPRAIVIEDPVFDVTLVVEN